jgi:hypothetical protein
MQKLGYKCDIISDLTYVEPGFSYAAYHTVITCTRLLNFHADKFRQQGTVIVDFVHADKLTQHHQECSLGNGVANLENEESHKRNTDFTWMMNGGSDYASDYIETLMGRHVFPVPKLWVPKLGDVRYNELAHPAPELELVLPDFIDKGNGWMSLVIAERLNQDYPGCIKAVHVFSTVALGTSKLSISPKIVTHSHHMTLKSALGKFNSSSNKVVFLSHQQKPSALQNMHLEIVCQGYALVHNSVALPCGYYYKDADVLGGVREIVKALESHDSTTDTYRKDAADAVAKYHPEHEHNCRAFKQLIRNQVNIAMQHNKMAFSAAAKAVAKPEPAVAKPEPAVAKPEPAVVNPVTAVPTAVPKAETEALPKAVALVNPEVAEPEVEPPRRSNRVRILRPSK